jgi:hypothetical protein
VSLVDTLKRLVGRGREVAGDNAEKIHEAVDKAGGFIDEKTGGKYSDRIGKGTDAIKHAFPERGAAPGAPPAPAPTPVPEPPAEPTPPADPAPPQG